jgi:hypothetical protein
MALQGLRQGLWAFGASVRSNDATKRLSTSVGALRTAREPGFLAHQTPPACAWCALSREAIDQALEGEDGSTALALRLAAGPWCADEHFPRWREVRGCQINGRGFVRRMLGLSVRLRLVTHGGHGR